MGAVILTILKMIGIALLCILGLILLLIGLLLFVPVRYRITAQKDAEDELKAARVTVRVTWLLHLLNVCFAYPERAYVRIRVLFFTVFRSDRPKKEKEKKQKERSETTHKTARKEQKDPKEQRKKTQAQQNRPDNQNGPDRQKELNGQNESNGQPEPDGQKKQKESEEHRSQGKSQAQNRQSTQEQQKAPDTQNDQNASDDPTTQNTPEKSPEQPEVKEKLSFKERFLRIVSKVWEILKNIRYTIRKIYDKIMDIIGNIRYYTEILKSDLFKETFQKCSGELLKLFKSIAPRKVKGRLRIGMEDPATTGKILGYYGMLYPLIGDHIDVVPDFDQTVLEGNILIKGKITLFKAIKTGIIVYFNKDLRKLIQLWKREGT